MEKIYPMPKVCEPFNELINKNSNKNWHLFCFFSKLYSVNGQ